MVADNVVSGVTCKKTSFRAYVRGWDPKAAFPHHTTWWNITLVVDELQQEEQLVRLTIHQEKLLFSSCIGDPVGQVDRHGHAHLFCGHNSDDCT